MPLTPDAKRFLAETIRGTAQNPEKGIRGRLLRAIHDEADRRYRLSVPIGEAGLDETHRKHRERIEAWTDERARATRSTSQAELKVIRARLIAQAEKEAAATLVNRLVLLRQLEASGLSKPTALTGGWNSKGYREFREFAPTLCINGTTDATEGYSTLLQLIFDELAVDLPGLFGDVGLTRLFPVPAATLREVIERLDDPVLSSAWTDDTTLGWVYQYWNDPDREALDAKISDGGKIEPHEIASKTQMFTERYMVEWLLQNSLGVTWLAMCRKRGWKADAERVLSALDARRAEWRKKREAGEVALDALMPTAGELEEHWKYYVPQPIPDAAVEKAPGSVRAIKILDPACGSGHFLVNAFGLLVALYREEAKHLGTPVTDREVAEAILENNLHGIDIDPRAIQIAAAGLYLKAKSLAKSARPKKLNLVAPILQLGNLPPDDPAVVLLRKDLKSEVGIPEELTTKLLSALAGVDYLGSLLKVDAAVDDAIKSVELDFERAHGQGDFFKGFPAQQVRLSVGEAKATILDKLEQFLARHSRSEDLGLRLDGEQLAAGVRFVRVARENQYDVVVGNPPYHGVGKLRDASYYAAQYPQGRADLFAGFYLRGLELLRSTGLCGMITLSNWMFLGAYKELRGVVRQNTVSLLADLGKSAFTTGGTLISTSCAVLRRGPQQGPSVALRPHEPSEVVRDDGQPGRTHAALLLQRGRYEFDPRGFEVIHGEPIVYWWSKEFLERYAAAPKLGDVSPARFGLTTGDNDRFVRQWQEVSPQIAASARWTSSVRELRSLPWVSFVLGGKGRAWQEPLRELCRWRGNGLEVKEKCVHQYGTVSKQVRNEDCYFRLGTAFTMIGAEFSARRHRCPSVIGNKGSSVFSNDLAATTCLMNSSLSKWVLQSLNPGIGFEVGDVNRLPVFPVSRAEDIFNTIDKVFAEHESCREASVEFRHPGLSHWRYAQSWAQRAVDSSESSPLPPYVPEPDPPEPGDFVSFAVGVALGRFGATGEGMLDQAPASSLPSGILFVGPDGSGSLEHPACRILLDTWKEHGTTVGEGDELRTYLRKSFFDFHKKLYETRPIYFPLSSTKKSFVAFVSIHRWANDTLNALLADHLMPAKRRLEGELEDLRTARAAGANKGKVEKRFTDVQRLLEELNDFITTATEVAEKGPPPPDDRTPKREVDVRYVMDLDDGVVVNSAALWPLLEPQWKDPRKWWKELANAQGKKDYDWSHLTARYFPTRVRKKCLEDPSLAVAHHCFWELYSAKAYAWELRLQDEIRPDFMINEPGSDEARVTFLKEHEREAKDIVAKEVKRREKKDAKTDDEGGAGPLFEDGQDGEAEAVDA